MMLRPIAVSQRVDVLEQRGERRDALDQRWTQFLAACGLFPILVPNAPAAAQVVLDYFSPEGVLLTGGNDLAAYGGDAPERDETERLLIDWAFAGKCPLMVVCRGMQMFVHSRGVPLHRVTGHAGTRHDVHFSDGSVMNVNSYHNWGLSAAPAGYEAWAVAPDGTVEAIRSSAQRVLGMLWHPEREAPFRREEIAIFSAHFGTLT